MRKTSYGLTRSISNAMSLFACFALIACSHKKKDSYQGYVEGEFVYVSSSQPGTLAHLYVSRGEKIASNTRLFFLDSDEEIDAERQALYQLRAANAQLADIEKGKRLQELETTRAQIDQALAEEKKSSAKLLRDENQLKSGGISQADLDESRAMAESNQARVRELEMQLVVAKMPARLDQIKAQIAQVAAAQAVLEQAQWKVHQKAVAATKAGVVFDTIYREGEWVPAGNPVVRMLPPQNVKVRFFVPETVLGHLSLGQTITMLCDGCSADIPAAITYISSESEYTPPVIYSNESKSKLIYMVEAHPSLENASRLRPGQPVEIRLP